YHSRFQEQVDSIRQRVPGIRHFIRVDGEASDADSLAAFIDRGSAAAIPDWADAHGNLEQLMGLVPTGGTTGPARGVRVTNLAWGTMMELAMRYWRCEDDSPEGPVCLCTAPLSHAAGPVAFAMFAMGGTNVILPGFDAGRVLRSIQHYRATHMFLPPTAFYS